MIYPSRGRLRDYSRKLRIRTVFHNEDLIDWKLFEKKVRGKKDEKGNYPNNIIPVGDYTDEEVEESFRYHLEQTEFDWRMMTSGLYRR